MFIYLMSCNDRQILTWLGKFLYKSFNTRNTKIYGSCIPSERTVPYCLYLWWCIRSWFYLSLWAMMEDHFTATVAWLHNNGHNQPENMAYWSVKLFNEISTSSIYRFILMVLTFMDTSKYFFFSTFILILLAYFIEWLILNSRIDISY